ncbi:TRAF-type zinc finger domain-containing protein 1-like [Ananas comosus]|uniref:TRAF-type zinc finger domain-containing protein 1-like n=1 Tax=Ananas comosus TaxID=4615 RepID=A0A6P5FPK9_ANACO|nr:TRAF-type zinc finger domain-containing protein 1-like [Ananas comosus]
MPPLKLIPIQYSAGIVGVIFSRTIVIHEAYCIRHNLVCQHEGCGVVLRKHMKVFHEPLHCPCGVVLEKEEMVQHQSSICPLRLIVCRFCRDMVQAGTEPLDARDRLRGLSERESICGSRTYPCLLSHDMLYTPKMLIDRF